MNVYVFMLRLVSVIFLIAGSQIEAAEKKYGPERIGITIAVIADTQYTTQKMDEGYGMRSKLADKFVNVSIRTTAQEFLALDNMQYMFEDMKERNIDVVMYLGDGVNSGCKDEIKCFFDALRESRESLGKPIFFTLGNHDYLAAGNQYDSEARAKTCGEGVNDFFSKADLIEVVDQFNQESYEKFADKSIFLSFKDNVATGPSTSSQSWETPLGDMCDWENEEGQHKNACFYSAVIEYRKDKLKGQLLIVDTSDYRDLVLQAELMGSSKIQFYGVRGSVSWKKAGQQSWINGQINGQTDVRIVASHYQAGKLKWLKYRVGRPGDILLEGQGRNLWLSAHSHEPDPEKRPISGKFCEGWCWGASDETTKYYSEYNVGSTTDYLPHFSIISDSFTGLKRESVPSTADYSEMQCAELVQSIELDDSYPSPYKSRSRVKTRLGLDGKYRGESYSHAIARTNIERYLSSIDESEKERYLRCLVYTAAKAEHSLFSFLWFL